jgi:NADH-quinone oxidoreductase subunit I
MTKTYDFSVFDIRQHNFEFANMTPEQIEEKKKLFEEHQKNKAQSAPAQPTPSAGEVAKPARPVFKPKIKPPGS